MLRDGIGLYKRGCVDTATKSAFDVELLRNSAGYKSREPLYIMCTSGCGRICQRTMSCAIKQQLIPYIHERD